MTELEILDKMEKIADALDFGLNENAIKIAKVKSRMDNWRRCPCCPNDENKYCGSMQCEKDVLENGHCCCNCYYPLNSNK